jgi:hypothetical protein
MHPKGAFRSLRSALRLAAIATVSVALLVPASAQFWSPFGGRSQPRPSQQGGGFNPFGGLFGSPPPQNPAPVDYSRAPPPQRKVDAAAATTTLVVVGDSMADWLAYGLEEAFAETPEMAIVRKHRSTAGLIRYDTRRDVEWPQVVKEMIAADKPKLIVMMVGMHDRQAIRERTPPPPGRNAGSAKQQQQQHQQQQSVTAPPPPPAPLDPELHAPQPGERQNADERPAEEQTIAAPEPPRSAAGNAGPFEFRSERWEAAYIRRIDATIAALKSAGVPVFWVGLPPQRATRATADSTYLNELYRQRAEKAGIVYVDVWEGFVDSSGQFAAQGPDFEGQIRRLRSGDGVYFTKPGARKLAHYVEREIQRTLANRTTPVALPTAIEPDTLTPGGRPGGPAQRPLVGPVVPLTALTTGQNELLGGGPARPASGPDPVATRVLTKGEAIPAPSGRADDFSWPRGGVAASDPSLAETTPTSAVLATPEQPAPPSQPTPRQSAPAQAASGQPKGQSTAAGSKTGEPKQPVQKRAPPTPSFFDNFPRPPGAIRPSASTQGAIR